MRVMLDERSIRFIEHFLREYPLRTALMVVLLILAGLAEGVGVITLLPVVEFAVGGSVEPAVAQIAVRLLETVRLPATLGTLLAFITIAMAVKAAFFWLAMRQVGYSVAQVATDLRLDLIQALMGARWSHFTTQPTGLFANAIGTEAARASWAYWHACSALAGLIQIAVYGATVILVSWKVGLVALIVAAAVLIGLRGLVNRSRRAGDEQTALMQSLMTRITELLPGIKPIKAMARESSVLPLLEEETRNYNEAQRRGIAAVEYLRALQEPTLVLVIALGLYGLLVIRGLPFSVALLLVVLFYRLMTRVNYVQSQYQAMVAGESAFWSLSKQIELAQAQRESGSGDGEIPSLDKAVVLDRVRFGYGERLVLNDVSITVTRGTLVAITGPSGAGKTTIVDVIAGLLRPQTGDVYADGVALGRMRLQEWRRLIGYVPQETLLFNSTIFQNVTLGDSRITRQRAEDALRAAGAGQFVSALAGGMDEVVGERGLQLSGGQRQRIAIARALAPRPQILILDEPTAALDPHTAAGICDTLKSLRDTITIVAVSHEPAVLQIADSVYHVADGVARLLKEEYAGTMNGSLQATDPDCNRRTS